jgi:hypothetical protein
MGSFLRFTILVAVALAVVTACCSSLVRALGAAGIEAPQTHLDVLDKWLARVPGMERSRPIAYLGDSTAVSEKAPKRAVPMVLGRALQQYPGAPRVISLATPGFGPADFYFLAAELASVRPTAIVLALNPAALSSSWISRQSHPEFVSVLGTRRWGEAFGLPLRVVGVTADRLVVYPLIEAAGLGKIWRRARSFQARVSKGWQTLLVASDGNNGPERRNDAAMLTRVLVGENKLDPGEQQRKRYGTALDGVESSNPSMRVLRATLEFWQRARIPVLVLMIPVDVEHFAKLGIANEDGMARTVGTLEGITQAAGAAFLDLHDLLPSKAFADAAGHYDYASDVNGPALISAQLAPKLAAMLSAED